MVATIAERMARKVEKLRVASQEAMAALHACALDKGGRFLVFGSVARGDIRYGGDIGVIVEFDAAPNFLLRARRDAIALP